MPVWDGMDPAVATELALAERLACFEAMLACDPAAVVLLDARSRACLYANGAASRLFGGDDIHSLRVASHEALDLRGFVEFVFELCETIAPPREAAVATVCLLRPDRTALDVEVMARAIAPHGRPALALFIRDVGEETANRLWLERFKAVLGETDDEILLIDPARQQYIFVNEATCRHRGLTREQLMSLGPAGLRDLQIAKLPLQYAGEKPGDSAAILGARYKSMIDNYPAMHVDERLIESPDGSRRAFEAVYKAAKFGGEWAVIGVLRDVTARKRVEAQLERRVEELTRSNEDLERFAYVISHDLSEPLRMVASYLQLIERRFPERFDGEPGEFMGFALEGAHRMKRLIDDLLAYSRAGSAGAPLELVDLEGVLDEALANLASAVERAQARIERQPLPRIVARRGAMVQLLQNLVGNAVKFRGEATPVVRVEALEQGDAWQLAVADNGVGIEPRIFERIFVVFQRLHPRGRYEGTGIGLAIAKKIVERHGGRIWVESTPGAGTTFRFLLPKTPPQDEERVS
jgi:signal transduction histidine kinase